MFPQNIETLAQEARNQLLQVSKYKVQKKRHKKKRIDKKWLKRYGYIELPNKYEVFDILCEFMDSSEVSKYCFEKMVENFANVKDIKLGQ